MTKKAFVAVTGASGTVYGTSIIKNLIELGIEVYVSATKDALANAQAETGVDYKDIKDYFTEQGITDITLFSEDEHGASPASGSFKIDYYIAAPASMGFVGRVASGISSNLPERCADVALKEKRPLVILFRETPLSIIHLENLTRLAKAGAIIMPAAPAFYNNPKTLKDSVDFITGKVFDILSIDHNIYKRWSQ